MPSSQSPEILLFLSPSVRPVADRCYARVGGEDPEGVKRTHERTSTDAHVHGRRLVASFAGLIAVAMNSSQARAEVDERSKDSLRR